MTQPLAGPVDLPSEKESEVASESKRARDVESAVSQVGVEEDSEVKAITHLRFHLDMDQS